MIAVQRNDEVDKIYQVAGYLFQYPLFLESAVDESEPHLREIPDFAMG